MAVVVQECWCERLPSRAVRRRRHKRAGRRARLAAATRYHRRQRDLPHAMAVCATDGRRQAPFASACAGGNELAAGMTAAPCLPSVGHRALRCAGSARCWRAGFGRRPGREANRAHWTNQIPRNWSIYSCQLTTSLMRMTGRGDVPRATSPHQPSPLVRVRRICESLRPRQPLQHELGARHSRAHRPSRLRQRWIARDGSGVEDGQQVPLRAQADIRSGIRRIGCGHDNLRDSSGERFYDNRYVIWARLWRGLLRDYEETQKMVALDEWMARTEHAVAGGAAA